MMTDFDPGIGSKLITRLTAMGVNPEEAKRHQCFITRKHSHDPLDIFVVMTCACGWRHEVTQVTAIRDTYKSTFALIERFTEHVIGPYRQAERVRKHRAAIRRARAGWPPR